MLLEEILQDQPGISMGDGTLYQMVINEQQKVHIRSFDEERFFYLYAKLGILPEGERRTELLETLMEANLFGQETQGAFFAWHRQSNTLVLMSMFDRDVATFQQYQSRLQLFVDMIDFWKNQLQQQPEIKEEEDLLKLMSRKKRIFFI